MEIAESFLSEILSNYTLLALILVMIFYYIKAKKSSQFDKQQTDKMRFGLSLMIIYLVIFSQTISKQYFGFFREFASIYIYSILIYYILASGLLMTAALTFFNGIYNIKKKIKKEI